MGFSQFVYTRKKYVNFLNISFLVLSCVFLISLYFHYPDIHALTNPYQLNRITGSNDCSELKHLPDFKSKCLYLKSHVPCLSQGYINYLSFLYCNFDKFPILGYVLLFFWLLVLFYLLGDTASEYFCFSLESLSEFLKLSHTVAGVTLLSLGNGAPDVFASFVSFMGTGTCEIALNTVIGGSSFVTLVVVGIISISLHRKQVRVDKFAFLRDACFLITVLGFLFVILIHGSINLWGAIGFSSVYVVYVAVVCLSLKIGVKGIDIEACSIQNSDLTVPILENWIEDGVLLDVDDKAEQKKCCLCLRSSTVWRISLWVTKMPLYLPRRLTIPVICETKWSKPVAVASVTLAPIFLSALWDFHYEDHNSNRTLLVYSIGCFMGTTFGFLAFFTTDNSNPPEKFLFPWLAGGFFMSIVWSYITAQELVALLVSLGYIFAISPSLLGLTVLAWGNSLGDLITNLTMALKGGNEGAQVAISGCYAGPIFNTLFGLGVCLVGVTWNEYPNSAVIQNDKYLLEALGYMFCGLLWAIVVLPKRGMKLDGVLGGGLLVVYFVSLASRLLQGVGSH